jgi:hypothetical protein
VLDIPPAGTERVFSLFTATPHFAAVGVDIDVDELVQATASSGNAHNPNSRAVTARQWCNRFADRFMEALGHPHVSLKRHKQRPCHSLSSEAQASSNAISSAVNDPCSEEDH